MNIFYLDKCPDKAAKLQYNKHVVKMILESAQMLCTAHHELLDDPDVPYKPAHVIIHQQYGLEVIIIIIIGYMTTCWL